MRIAHVSDCYLPRLGGIEVQVRATSIAQAARGDRVSVITATPGESTPDPGIDVVRVDANLPFDTPVHPLGIQRIRAALEAIRPDVVHVHAGVVSPFAWGAVRAAARRRLPVLVTVHSVWGPLAGPGFALSDAVGRWTGWGVTLSAVSSLASSTFTANLTRSPRQLRSRSA
mgnify:CR=1 FL=1